MYFGLGVGEPNIIVRGGVGYGRSYGMSGYGYPGGTRLIVCPPGCMGPCCMRMGMCPPGCIGPCCANRQLMMSQMNGQMSQMNGQMSQINGQMMPINRQMTYNGPNRMGLGGWMGGNNQPDYMNGVNNGGAMGGVGSNGVMNYPQNRENFPQNQMRNIGVNVPQQKESIQFQKELAEQLPLKAKAEGEVHKEKQCNKEIQMQQMSINTVKQMVEESEKSREDQFNMQSGSLKQQPQQIESSQPILYQGDIYQLTNNKWILTKSAALTSKSLLNIFIHSIIKIKIKAQSQVPNTRIIKISTRTNNHFLCVKTQQQVQWMTKIIWLKLRSMGVMCQLAQQYSGRVESYILRKNFFGGWERNYGIAEGESFKIAEESNVVASKNIMGVQEIWTRFQMIQRNMLVVKMDNGSKLEVAVPIEGGLAWLRGLHLLLSSH